ncbi:hypothetical protein [Micromonospora sp. NPDC047074]|uniref:hypothetical protein n=1 Tax=Micromonospora sp. NPDC047074 TaxID=3154339 RepID=UPI0033C3C57D
MTRRILATLVAAVTVPAAAIVPVPAPASADPLPIGRCTTSSGVVLAVDFRSWGGPLLRSCGTTPTTGYELLNQGGWKTTGTQHDGPGFICRISHAGFDNGTPYPTPADEKCVLTPPASAYWSYWHADPGADTWQYSQLGAMSYQPKPGSVDLWIFGGTDIGGTRGGPTFSPDSVRAHNATPVTTAPPTGGAPAPTRAPAQPPVPGAPGTPPGGAQPTTGPTRSPAVDIGATASTRPPTGPPGTAPPTSGGTAPQTGPAVVDAVPTSASAPTERGSARPLLFTLGALAVFAIAGTALAARRRRHTADAWPE